MNIPNLITIFRIILIPFFVYQVVRGHFGNAAYLFALAAVSDALDGFVARFWSLKTRLGTFLDPLADKLLVTTAYVGLGLLGLLPSWLVITVISRDIIIVLGALAVHILRGDLHIRPTLVSKVNTFFQLLVVVLCLLGASGWEGATAEALRLALPWLYGVTVFLTALSGVVYILGGLKALEEE